MERFLQVCFVHHSLPLNFPSWTHDLVWCCLFDPQLEDPAAGALQPSSSGPGNLLLVIHFRVDIPAIAKHIKKMMFYVLIRILPESARWLLTQGRKKTAIQEIQRAARLNRRTISQELLEKVNSIKTALSIKGNSFELKTEINE